MPEHPPVFAGRAAEALMKQMAEIAGIFAIAHLFAQLPDPQLRRLLQQLLCPAHAHGEQILGKGQARLLAEQPAQIIRMQKQHLGRQITQAQLRVLHGGIYLLSTNCSGWNTLKPLIPPKYNFPSDDFNEDRAIN